MTESKFPRLEVLQSLYELTSVIAENRFITTRPATTNESMQEFLLIRLPQRIIQPGDTFQLTTGQISVFVRDVQGGLENTLRLEQLQDSIVKLFPVRTPLYIATRPILLNGGSDTLGFHSLIIQFNIRIHKDFDIHSNKI